MTAVAQSQSDAQGNVNTLTLPTTPETTVKNPTTPDGKPVTAKDLAALGQGQKKSLTVRDGVTGQQYQLGSPDTPVAG